MIKPKKIPEEILNSLNKTYLQTLASGATLSYQKVFPAEFPNVGINQRNQSRNDYLGMVITKPKNCSNKIVFGFSYLDNEDGQDDEDLYVLDLAKKEIEYFPKGSYEKENSLYAGTHKGIKDFLRKTK